MKRAAELQQLLTTETTYFCQRLETFLQTPPFAAMVQADSPASTPSLVEQTGAKPEEA